jgi:predicted amidohydrolase
MLRIGFYQFRPWFGQVKKNLEKVVLALQDVSADLVVLPELPFTGYYFKDRQEVTALAEAVSDSATVTGLVDLCKERNFYLVTGFAEKDKEKYFNSALLLGPEGVIHTYRKIHLFNEEKVWFDPGDKPLQIQKVRGVNLGVMVCFDWIFPEVVRSLALLGADIICHPSNLVLSYCQDAMVTRCLENNVFAVTANRFGADKRSQGTLRFTGKSQITAPRGKVLFRAPSQREVLHVEAIDPSLARDKSITARNDLLHDRRPDFYVS